MEGAKELLAGGGEAAGEDNEGFTPLHRYYRGEYIRGVSNEN